MTILDQVKQITAVKLVGLDELLLPFTSHPNTLGVIDQGSPLLDGISAHYTDKYIVKSISGLEPPDQNVAIAATASGGRFQGKTSEDRELVFLIELNPDLDAGETPKLLRDNLYTMLNTGYDPKVDIQLMWGVFPIAHEFAYVTKFEASIFDANPVVQITFTCLNPTFRAFDNVAYDPADLSETDPDIYNYGTAETGFQFSVKFDFSMDGWYIKSARDQSIGMNFDFLFHADDVLSVSTIQGQTYVHWNKHRGKVSNKLGILTHDSEFIQLYPGHNHFVVPAKVGRWHWNSKLTFTPHYWGI